MRTDLGPTFTEELERSRLDNVHDHNDLLVSYAHTVTHVLAHTLLCKVLEQFELT